MRTLYLIMALMLFSCSKEEAPETFDTVNLTGTRWGYLSTAGGYLRYHNIEFTDDQKALFFITSADFKVQIGPKEGLSYLVEDKGKRVPTVVLYGVKEVGYIPNDYINTDDPNTIKAMYMREEDSDNLSYLYIKGFEFTKINKWMLDK